MTGVEREGERNRERKRDIRERERDDDEGHEYLRYRAYRLSSQTVI